MTRIEICGGIASGKTTLANVLAPTAVRERFKENPFWSAFYADPARWFEEKNLCFLVQHTGAIKGAPDPSFVVCDFAVIQDLAYARLAPRPEHIAVMGMLYAHLYGQLSPPSLIVHLRCAPAVQLQRITARARPEEANITIDYLSALNDAIDVILDGVRWHTPVHTIASDTVDFASDNACAAAVTSDVLARATLLAR
jgi:deoxyadenosine/deoxycytidine kinase